MGKCYGGHHQFFSIYDYQGEFCGIIELQKPNTTTPRIGITPSVVPMFMQKVSKIHNVEYFVIQIAKSNSHSRHVFEKLWAELINEQESNIIKAMKRMLELSGGDREIYKEYQAALEEEDPICKYKLNLTNDCWYWKLCWGIVWANQG